MFGFRLIDAVIQQTGNDDLLPKTDCAKYISAKTGQYSFVGIFNRVV